MTSIYEEAGYKFRWEKKPSIIAGKPCNHCDMEWPAGTIFHLKVSRYLGHAVETLCPDCWEKGIR